MPDSRLDQLARELRRRDLAEAKAREAIRLVQQEAADKKAADERAAERVAAAQATRRGAWLNHFLTTADPKQPVDFVAAEKSIPADVTAWPPGYDQTRAAFLGTPTAEQRPDFAATTIGKLLNRESHHE